MTDFRTYIEQSKKRCKENYRLDPNSVPSLQVELTAEEIERSRKKLEVSLPIIHHFMEKVIYYMNGAPILIATTDEEGYLIDQFGDPSIMEMVNTFGIHNGVRFDEKRAGTNSISLSLYHGTPVALVGDDHYYDALHGIACYSAPFSYSGDGHLTGTVSIMTLVDYASHFHLGLLSSTVDSIERELRLMEKNNELEILNRIMIDTTPLGVLMTDKEGYITRYNASLEEIMDYETKERFDQGEQTYYIKPYIDQVLKTGAKVENEEVTIYMDDERKKRICQLDVLPLFDGDKIIGTFAQLRDMTNYYDLQKQLIQSEKLSTLGKFSAGLAHEIRNPLTSIIGLTELLKEGQHQEQYLAVISTELERMKTLVNQFVLLGKPTAIQPGPCNLHRLISDTIDLMKSSLRSQGISIGFQSEAQDLIVSLDESKIKQVLINFIKNASEAMADGGNITVRLTSDRTTGEMVVTIEDEGEGMSPDQVANLGTLFYTSKEHGLGMGLPICFEIVKAHHGDIRFESEKGTGTKAELHLPI